MKRINSLVWGTVLLLIGVVLTLGQLTNIRLDGNMTWPILLLGAGLIFHLYYFFTREQNEGLLVPGGILLVFGVMILLIQTAGQSLGKLWPLLILGPAFGLFELYVFSRGRKGSMIPVFILTAIGGGFLLMNYDVAKSQVILGMLAVCLGAGLMISSFVRSSRHKGGSSTFEAKAEPQTDHAEPPETPPAN